MTKRNVVSLVKFRHRNSNLAELSRVLVISRDNHCPIVLSKSSKLPRPGVQELVPVHGIRPSRYT